MPPDIRTGLCGFTIAMGGYARRFPVVEVQQTFYEPPADAVMRRWRAATEPSLEYTMKVWQLVTHPATSPTYRRLKRPLEPGETPGSFGDTPAVAAGWRRSLECAEVLDASAMLFQCPASFRPDAVNVASMRRFFTSISRPPARLLWEPRGKAWIEQRDLALRLCDELGLVHVVDPFVTAPAPGRAIYWRLHGIGSARHSYTDWELDQLHSLLIGTGVGEPGYVMFNNLPRVGDASRFVARVAARGRR